MINRKSWRHCNTISTVNIPDVIRHWKAAKRGKRRSKFGTEFPSIRGMRHHCRRRNELRRISWQHLFNLVFSPLVISFLLCLVYCFRLFCYLSKARQATSPYFFQKVVIWTTEAKTLLKPLY